MFNASDSSMNGPCNTYVIDTPINSKTEMS